MKTDKPELTMQGAVEGLSELLKSIQEDKTVKHETWRETKIKNAIWILNQQIKPVAPIKITEFDIMKEMHTLGMDISMVNKLLRLEIARSGGTITLELDKLTFKKLMDDQLPGAKKYMIGLYIVNRVQYGEIKESFNQ